MSNVLSLQGGTMSELIQQGGIMMYPIIFSSVIALAVIFERSICFIKLKKPKESVLSEFISTVLSKSPKTAAEFIENENSLFKNFFISMITEKNADNSEKAAINEGEKIIFTLNRRLSVLSVLGSVVPLMGLLGTVLGMIKVFSKVAAMGDISDISVLAGGIWEALITTAAGMAVAIPMVLAYHYFERKTEKIAFFMKTNGDRIIKELKEAGFFKDGI